MFRKIFYCTLPDIGGFFPTAILERIFAQHLTLVDFLPKPDIGGFFSPPSFRGFYKAFHTFIDSSGSSVANTIPIQNRFNPTEVHMGFKSVTFFTSVRCVGIRIGCEYTVQLYIVPTHWLRCGISAGLTQPAARHRSPYIHQDYQYNRIMFLNAQHCMYIVRDHTYIAYVHTVPLTEGRLNKSKIMDWIPCPSPVSLKRGKRPTDIQGEERIREM